MKKQVLLRALLGFPLGVFTGFTITVVISLFFATGRYLSAEPTLVASNGSELNAVVLQYLLSGVLGAGFAAGSLIWENERWSLLQRTLLHLGLSSLLMLPIAYWAHWMPHTLAGFAIYFLIFAGFYLVIWVAQYIAWMRKVRDINQRLQNK